MLTAFWKGLGSKLADQFALRLAGAATVFWLGGALAWWWRLEQDCHRSPCRAFPAGLADRLRELSAPFQLAALVALIGLLALSTALVGTLTRPLLRLLSGHWPGPLGDRLRRRALNGAGRLAARAQWLGAERERRSLSAGEAAEFARLERRIRRTVFTPEAVGATRLANLLRAYEDRTRDKYGLDPVACWPHLWLTLDADARAELDLVRGRLDAAAHLLLWCLLSALWTPVAWWMLPASIVLAAAVYRIRLLEAAESWSGMVETMYDLYRFGLYEALRLEPPADPTTEAEMGRAVSQYLWYGTAENGTRFVHPGPTG
ncbi:hypothetical protein [Streptomyces sp. KR55]|uniref:hypothetical protein n=1 Tax=Streptomyces sp. KR55 TaxID=3457425 RepID=UPI003FD3F5CD